MLRKMIIGSSFAVAAMSVAMSGARAASCDISDQECLREQVIANIASGESILFNIPVNDRINSSISLNDPQFSNALNSLPTLSVDAQGRIGELIKTQGPNIFNKLANIEGGIFITRLNDILKKLGVTQQIL